MTRDDKDPSTAEMFPGLLTADQVAQKLKDSGIRRLRHKVWSHQKALLIERYLAFFVMVTRHGTYIDGFAGPQYSQQQESWSAKRVLALKPRRLRHFFLCDLAEENVRALQTLWDNQPPADPKKDSKRDCRILAGDFNERVRDVLDSGIVTENEATFALLDQRTLECHWRTVQTLAEHKKSGRKIELFYFLAIKWLHRSLAALTVNEDTGNAWWGDDGWKSLINLKQDAIRDIVTARFRGLGYEHVMPYPIFEKENGVGATMYYMIHASDHPDAPGLMWRAYDQAVGSVLPPKQAILFEAPEKQ